MKVDRRTWPILVRVGLLWVPSRRVAWGSFWFSALLSVGMIAFGLFGFPFLVRRFMPPDIQLTMMFAAVSCLAGCIMLIAPIGYYFSIRWVDRHSSWS